MRRWVRISTPPVRDARKPLYDVDALIFAKDLAAPLRSMVRDISKSGARLELQDLPRPS